MNRAPLLLVLVWASVPVVAVSQAAPRRPTMALHLGVGSHHGGIGAAGEVYLLRGDLSAWLGVGVWPVLGANVAWGAALRAYTTAAPDQHRIFADVSWTLVQLSGTGRVVHLTYGPGLTIGYSYVGRSGLTVTSGVGLALLHGVELQPMFQLAGGWTWRR